MIRATHHDKDCIVKILTHSFEDNKSVNYIVKQDGKRIDRIKSLMQYSFEVCHLFGDVFLSEDKKACALIVKPDQKKACLKSISLDVKLAIDCIGLSNIKKAMTRESKIKTLHPKHPFNYLWFIGVHPEDQNKGIGSKLLGEVIKESKSQERPIYLETSTVKNLPWYQKFGFKIFEELDFGYKLFCLKNK